MKRTDWAVREYGIRPAGKPDRCFYCGSLSGEQHRHDCVIRSRTVVVRTIVEHTINVPESWTKELIEFTEGSSCSDNLIANLSSLLERLKDHSCTCGMVSVEYVREATSEDEEASRLFVNELPS